MCNNSIIEDYIVDGQGDPLSYGFQIKGGSNNTESATISDCICLNNAENQIVEDIDTTLVDNITSIDLFETLEADNETPSVSGLSLIKTDNTRPTTIKDFHDRTEGQIITLLITDELTTIDENTRISLFRHLPISADALWRTFSFTLRECVWWEHNRRGYY